MERSQRSSCTQGLPPSVLSHGPRTGHERDLGVQSKLSLPQLSPIPPQEAVGGGALPDDGVHAPHLRGTLQHAEGLREGVALVGRGQGGPENQTDGQKVSGQGCPKAGAQHTAGAILPDVISHCKRTPRPSSQAERVASPAQSPATAKGPAPMKGWSVEPGRPHSPRTWAADPWLAHFGVHWLGRKWKIKSKPSPAWESYLVVDPEPMGRGGAVAVVSVPQVPDVTRNGTGSQARGAGTWLNAEPGCNETISESPWPIQGSSPNWEQLQDFTAGQDWLCVTHLHVTNRAGSYSWIKGTPFMGKRTMEPR